MIDKTSVLQIIGSLMKHPQYLSETDKYHLTLEDFSTKFNRCIYVAIDSLYRDGAKYIQPIDIENYLETNASASETFKKNNGIEYLQDAVYIADERNFEYYYKRLKKFNLLNSLNKIGINTDEFYIDDLTKPNAFEINAHFEEISIDEILTSIKKDVLSVERNFIQNDTTETRSAFEGIEDIINNANSGADIGVPIQGEYLNEVMAGARLGTMVVRSAGSGTGKTRQAVGDACYIAYPYRYNEWTDKWEHEGTGKSTLFIATEQTISEIQKMVLAYLTGFNESKFRYGDFNEKELRILRQAMWVMERYKENFHIVQMPNPSISLVKNLVREQVLLHQIEYVFYDYIFIGPSLLSEFKGVALRNDEILLMFATALKDLAVELNIFVMTATQVNANADNSNGIRNEASIAGSRAVVNKADIGVVMARPTKEELDLLSSVSNEVPNCVTDVYKVRSGEWTQVRIWSYIDLGNLRKKDLYMTDSRLELVKNYDRKYIYEIDWTEYDYISELKELNELK